MSDDDLTKGGGDDARPDAKVDIADALQAFEYVSEAENDNRRAYIDDLRFARLAQQWPEAIRQQREAEDRPVLTLNKMPAFIRQVVNDARQNKPAIKVHPADSAADSDTAEIYNGLIRNIEYTSNADVAYDTAIESAVTGGFGYFKVSLDYAHDDSFDLDIGIQRVANPLSIYGDPESTAADSSDWNSAFELNWISKEAFKRNYPKADASDWSGYTDVKSREDWFRENQVCLASWWKREEITRRIVKLSDGTIMGADEFADLYAELSAELDARGISVVGERDVASWKVQRHLFNGRETLSTEQWPGLYIPIIPVYGDEVNEEGKRHFRSLTRDAQDPQRMFNYWRTTATELVALAPRVPFIGPKGAFKSDAKNWATANRVSHPYLEYDIVQGGPPPQRQPMDTGAAAGALQEAMNAADDMKSIIGLYDASLGARGNETSGKAILARQREGDVSTFHFTDNMSRAIRHAGRIIIDLIPKVYNTERVVRVLGEDGVPKTVPIQQPVPVLDPNTGEPQVQESMGPMGQPVRQPVTRIYDLGIGKYDLTVTTGPSYTTKREEAASQMVQMAQAFPPLMQLAGDLLVKNLDWPGADEVADRLKKSLPPNLQENGGIPPQVQQMIEQGQKLIQQLQNENQLMKLQLANKSAEVQLKQGDLAVKGYDAETRRMDVIGGTEAGGLPGDPTKVAEIQIDANRAETERYDAVTDRMRVVHDMNKPAPLPQQNYPGAFQR